MSTYNAAYHKKWRLDQHRGAPRRYVDARPVRNHVSSLLGAGATRRAIADAASVTPTTITRLLQGQAQMRRVVAGRIVSVQVRDTQRRDNGAKFVPILGTRRRIQAMMALGHGYPQIAAATGDPLVHSQIVANCLHQSNDWISQTNHDRIATAYRTLSKCEGLNSRAKKAAERYGYRSPIAWDDTDDPTETGFEVVTTSIRKPGKTALIDVDEVAWLLTQRVYTRESLAAHLGISWNTIYTACRRAGREDLTDRILMNTPGATVHCPRIQERTMHRAS